jgi:uncharacterized tellurite resistance protein B-like protein
MRRRITGERASAETEPVSTYDQFKGNWLAETARSQLQAKAADADALIGAGQQALGFEDAAQRNYAASMRRRQLAQLRRKMLIQCYRP